MNEALGIWTIAEFHLTHSIRGAACSRAMRLQPGVIGFIQFENFDFTCKARFDRAQSNRRNAAIAFIRLNDFDLLHAGSALPDLVRVGQEIPYPLARRTNCDITL